MIGYCNCFRSMILFFYIYEKLWKFREAVVKGSKEKNKKNRKNGWSEKSGA